MLGLNASMAPAPRYHFSGIAGAGMNPLARLMRAWGHEVQGSDRSLDQGKNRDLADRLRGMGIRSDPQDGKAVTRRPSTASSTPRPSSRTRPRCARRARSASSWSAAAPARRGGRTPARPGVAIAGTSGKSTITGMLAWILRAGRARRRSWAARPLVGEGFTAASPPAGRGAGGRRGLRIRRHAGRLPPDHRRWSTTSAATTTSSARCARSSPPSPRNCQRLLVNAGCAEAARSGARFGASSYGVAGAADCRARAHRRRTRPRARACCMSSGDNCTSTCRSPARTTSRTPRGRGARLERGSRRSAIAAALARFPGVARRFEVVGVTPAASAWSTTTLTTARRSAPRSPPRRRGCSPDRRDLPAARLRPGALPAPRAQGDAAGGPARPKTASATPRSSTPAAP